MKKLPILLSSSLIAGLIFSSTAFAADLKMKVNGKNITFSYGTPFIEKGSSLLPLRDLLLALGVQNDDQHIIWDNKAQSVTVLKDSTTLKLSVGKKEVYKNGEIFKTLEVPAKNVDGRIYLPARAVAEALGNKVSYDGGSGTVLVNSDSNTTQTSFNVENLKTIVPNVTNNEIQLSDSSYQLLVNNKELFFGEGRKLRSLEDKLSDPELAKNVQILVVIIDEINEETLADGTLITKALVHTGGNTSPITNKWVEETFYQLIYVGKTTLKKNDHAYINGLQVGTSSITATNQLGVQSQEPLYFVIAGNLNDLTQYVNGLEGLESSSSSAGLVEKFPTKDEETLKFMQVSMSGTTIQIQHLSKKIDSFNVKKIEIDGYSFEPTTPITISLATGAYAEPTLKLSQLRNSSGVALVPIDGKTYTINLTTDVGTTSKVVDYTTSNKDVLKAIKLDANIADSGLELQYPTGIELAITKISISTSFDGDFNYQPSSPVSIKSGSNISSIPFSNFKNSSGIVYAPSKNGTNQVIFETDLGTITLSKLLLPAEKPYTGGQPNNADDLQIPADPIEGNEIVTY